MHEKRGREGGCEVNYMWHSESQSSSWLFRGVGLFCKLMLGQSGGLWVFEEDVQILSLSCYCIIIHIHFPPFRECVADIWSMKPVIQSNMSMCASSLPTCSRRFVNTPLHFPSAWDCFPSARRIHIATWKFKMEVGALLYTASKLLKSSYH